MNNAFFSSVYIILLNWKDYEDTKSCILSFDAVTYPNFKIVVVDNFSNDGSVEKLKVEFPEIIYVLNSGNFGFSRGCTAGMRKAYEMGADYVLVLNNDMLVEPGFIEPAIIEAKKEPKLGAVTGKIMYIDKPNVFWQAGGHINSWRSQGIPRGKGETDKGQYDEICDTGWASGAMSLIPRSTLESVGYFPEEYFFGLEEWDYSTAILNSNLKIRYVPDFKAYHKAGGSYKAGHPVLNIYGGYMGKMIYAEKYLSPPMWQLWRIAFWFFLKFKWPILAREGCQNEEDYKVKLSAGYMAFKDHKTIKYVGLPELESAARRLGPAPSWGNEWVSN